VTRPGATRGRLTPRRLALALLASLLALAVAMLASVLVEFDASGATRALGLLDPLSDDPVQRQIFFTYRLPRVLAAAVVGAGLSAAGCAFQAVLRNPLAEPFTLGISSGAALAAVIAIRFGLDQTALGYTGIGLAALAGAAVTVSVVWRLGRIGDNLPPATLLLAGVTIASFCASATMLIQYTADFGEVYRFIRWMMGGLEGTLAAPLARTAVGIGAGCAILIAVARDLNALSAGPDAAASVGVDPVRTATIAFFTSSLIVGAAIALAGPIGFIGLLVPHAMRALVGPDHRVLLPTSMISGATMLVLCDGAAREVVAPDQLPVGVVTALLGGPFFLYLLLRRKSRAALWSGT
jgi:iron complex transport system permease protein